ncbi:hypothetical protein R3P38DRAFT_2841249, partial [Favolaschia claudopus]
MSAEKLPLRILYALNGSSQYILARSQEAVPIEFIPSSQEFGAAVASSSRSVAPQPPRYASASLKTCLEAIRRSSPEITQDSSPDFSVYLLDPLETTPASLSDALGTPVAVGLGLMSLALSTNETEVVPVAGTVKVSATGQDVLELVFSLRETSSRPQVSKQKKSRASNALTTSATNTSIKDKKPVPYPTRRTPPTIPRTQSDKLLAVAPIYVGPERGPRGGSRSQEDDDDDDVIVLDGPQRRDSVPVVSGKDPSEPSPLLDLLAFLKVISPEVERNQALGNVLGLMHGLDGSAMQHPPPELANAMSMFLTMQGAAATRGRQPDTPSAPSSQHRRQSSSTDGEIVVLNKENVNPKVFRRRSEREKEVPKLSASSSMPTVTRPSASRAPSSHPPEPPNMLPTSQPLSRKRTLSEAMPEQGSGRDNASDAAQYYRQPERTMSESSVMPPPRWDPPSPDPPKSRKRKNIASSPGRGFFTETAVTKPFKQVVSASSPVRPSKKPFVLPNWARTDTATTPRLSDLAIQTKELEEEMKKKEAQQRRKRKYEEDREAGKLKRRRAVNGRSTSAYMNAERPSDSVQQRRSTSLMMALPVSALAPPVAATSEFPSFVGQISSASLASSASPSLLVPSTPPRKRRATVSGTPDSLFTPGAHSLFSPAPGSSRAGAVLKFVRRSLSPSTRNAHANDPVPNQSNVKADEDALERELESAFDDFPSNSLPIASSDVDGVVDEGSQGYDSDDSDEEETPPRKQHWVGLPPSSPPPPSSPCLGPSAMDDGEIDEPPLTTSQADSSSPEETISSPDTDMNPYSMDQLAKMFDFDDLANLCPPGDAEKTAALFEQFTTNSTLDGKSQLQLDWKLDGTNTEFDFAEFWESVKPLVDASSAPAGDEEAIDHGKLAGDVHALFSGCL